MSKEEQKSMDEQVLQVANRAGEQRQCEAAEKAREEERREKMRYYALQRRKAMAKMLLRLIGCLLGAGVFVAVMLYPAAVSVVGCAGVMSFVVMAAITVDRHSRRWR